MMKTLLKAQTISPQSHPVVYSAMARWSALIVLFSLMMSPARPQSASSPSPLQSVNPMIGTGGDPDDGINIFPGVSTPFGMVQLSPDTEDHGPGYHYAQARIKGFSMTHMSGAGCANEGDVFFTATTGPIVTQVSDFQTPYSHNREKASPGYYQVQLLESGINAELSSTDHTGVARFTFPAGKPANVLLPISHTLNKTESASVQIVGDRRIEGYVENHAFCTRKETYKVYFVMTFSRPFAKSGTWTIDHDRGPVNLVQGGRIAQQTKPEEQAGAYASWEAQKSEQSITANIGISYVDEAGAEKNLTAEAERKDFPAIHRQAEAAWNKELLVIEVQGGSAAQRTVFYTALYHCLLMPSLFDDVDGRYLGFDGQKHNVQSGHHVYANFSGWDIYRSELPLLSMIEPQRMEDMAQSVVLMYQQGGWIDRWPQINLYTNDMDGSPLSIGLATAWLDGLHGFDINTAWEGMLKDATQAPPPGKLYHGEDGINWVNKIHYVPEDQVEYSVSRTQEYALAYASLYRLATALGKTAEAKMLYDRALYYRNVFDPDDRLFRPRKADGSWIPEFNPAQDGHGFTEGSGWHYQSFAPADLKWLITAVGRDTFNKRMTEFFNYPAPGWYAQYYDSFNETDMQAPFVFNFSGEPWQTQRIVRRILKENYTDAPDGIPGNDDCGAMSSWAVLSMIGIYSVDPSSLAYELVAPTFSKVVIHLHDPYPGNTFTMETSPHPGSSPYIQAVTMNGHDYKPNWISFQDIRAGGVLQFALGSEPNKAWGSAAKDSPPSLSDAR